MASPLLDTIRNRVETWRDDYEGEHGFRPGQGNDATERQELANMLRSQDAAARGETINDAWWKRNYWQNQRANSPEYQRYLSRADEMLALAEAATRNAERTRETPAPPYGEPARQGDTTAVGEGTQQQLRVPSPAGLRRVTSAWETPQQSRAASTDTSFDRPASWYRSEPLGTPFFQNEDLEEIGADPTLRESLSNVDDALAHIIYSTGRGGWDFTNALLRGTGAAYGIAANRPPETTAPYRAAEWIDERLAPEDNPLYQEEYADSFELSGLPRMAAHLGPGLALGWNYGFIPALAPYLFGLFGETYTPTPRDDERRRVPQP